MLSHGHQVGPVRRALSTNTLGLVARTVESAPGWPIRVQEDSIPQDTQKVKDGDGDDKPARHSARHSHPPPPGRTALRVSIDACERLAAPLTGQRWLEATSAEPWTGRRVGLVVP